MIRNTINITARITAIAIRTGRTVARVWAKETPNIRPRASVKRAPIIARTIL